MTAMTGRTAKYGVDLKSSSPTGTTKWMGWSNDFFGQSKTNSAPLCEEERRRNRRVAVERLIYVSERFSKQWLCVQQRGHAKVLAGTAPPHSSTVRTRVLLLDFSPPRAQPWDARARRHLLPLSRDLSLLGGCSEFSPKLEKIEIQ